MKNTLFKKYIARPNVEGWRETTFVIIQSKLSFLGLWKKRPGNTVESEKEES